MHSVAAYRRLPLCRSLANPPTNEEEAFFHHLWGWLFCAGSAKIAKSNDSRFIRIKEAGTKEISKLRRYDMVMVNAMGRRVGTAYELENGEIIYVPE